MKSRGGILIGMGGGPESVKHEDYTCVNTLVGNVKSSLHGTYHAVSARGLPRYLADMVPRLGYVAVRTPPMPMRLLTIAEVRW
jgi:hypothetical protein